MSAEIKRIPFCVVALEVEKLYQKKFPEGDDKAITEHCEYIATFIESCGFSIDEYLELWCKEQEN